MRSKCKVDTYYMA